jgi:hypothetical protein
LIDGRSWEREKVVEFADGVFFEAAFAAGIDFFF